MKASGNSIWLPAKKTPALFFSLALLLSLFSQCRTAERWHSATLLFFDTVCDVQVFCALQEFTLAQREVGRAFSEIELRFSPQRTDLSSPEVLELFRKALAVNRDSGGCFDITVGPLSELWGFSSKTYRVPSPEEIWEALLLIGMDKVKEENGRLAVLPGMKLDWGGIAKGWGVDLAAKSLQEMGIPSGFINAGGDLFCWGKNPNRGPWRVGIKHPRQSGFLGVLELSGLGAATSGDYQRFFEVQGVRYHHIYDPKTGYPSRGKQSVTVIGPETSVCDALSTALFVGREPAAILSKFPGYGAVAVDDSGRVTVLGKNFPLELY